MLNNLIAQLFARIMVLRDEEEGQTTVEYALVIAGCVVLGGLIAAVLVPGVRDFFNDVVGDLTP